MEKNNENIVNDKFLNNDGTGDRMIVPQKSWPGHATRSLSLILLLLLAAPCMWLRAAVSEVDGGIQFMYDAPDAQSVSVAGTFNSWSTTETQMQKGDGGVWAVTVMLPPGKHQYKFVVDGNWFFDPDHSNLMDDGYGGSNSLVEIDGKGKMVATKEVKREGIASMINPKVFFTGRYYTKYILQKKKEESRYMLNNPEHDIDLGLKINFNNQFEGYTVMNMNNIENGTYVRFKHTYLKMKTDYFDLIAFDKYGFITFDDPLRSVGDIGRYDYAFGYNQRGASLKTSDSYFDNLLDGVPLRCSIEAFYSDEVDYSDFNTWAGRMKTSWLISQRENSEKVLRLGGTLYSACYKQSESYDEKHDSYAFDATYEHKMMGSGWRNPMLFAMDAEFSSFENRWFAEGIYMGDTLIATDKEFTWQEGDVSWLGLRVEFPAALKVYGNWQSNNIQMNYVTDNSFNYVSEEISRNRFGLGADFETGDFTAHFGMKYWTYEFPDSLVDWNNYYRYMEKTDGNGRWFQRYSDMPFNRYTVLGYEEALVWNLALGYKFDLFLPIDIDWDAAFAHQGFMREAKYIENVIAVGIHLSKEWMIWSSTRVPYYNDPYLGLETDFGNDEDVWVCNYTELAYILSDQVRLSFGWGVNPRALNGVTDEFYEGGRDEYLTEAADYEEYTENAYLDTGEKIRQAEQTLENEKRFMLEATLKF